MRVTEIEPGREPKLEEVRKQISDDLALDLALDVLVKRANQVEDALAGGGSIVDAAQDIGAKVLKTAPVDAAGKLRSGASQPGLPTDERFAQTAFTINKGDSSDLLELSNGGFFMVRVDDIVAAAKRPLNQVRAEVAAAWKADWLNNRARKAAEEIRDAAKGGTPLAELAAEKGLSVEKSAPVARVLAPFQKLPCPALYSKIYLRPKWEKLLWGRPPTVMP